jgi:hypothetical protein
MTTPAFTRSIEFKIALIAFDRRTSRAVRVDYTYTPPWPYCAVPTGTECIGKSELNLGLVSVAVPRWSRKSTQQPVSREPIWVPMGTLLTGTFSARMHNELQARVDVQARDADRMNRVRAGLSVPALPEQI